MGLVVDFEDKDSARTRFLECSSFSSLSTPEPGYTAAGAPYSLRLP